MLFRSNPTTTLIAKIVPPPAPQMRTSSWMRYRSLSLSMLSSCATIAAPTIAVSMSVSSSACRVLGAGTRRQVGIDQCRELSTLSPRGCWRWAEIPSAGYFSPEALANALSGMTQLRIVSFHFLAFPRHRGFISLPLPPGERILLPPLTRLK